MSSKRKSPPSKLPEGPDLTDGMSETLAAALRTSHHADAKENNDSSLEDRISRGSSPSSTKRAAEDTTSSSSLLAGGKMSPSSETSSVVASGSEFEDFFSNEEDGGGGGDRSSPSLKRPRRYPSVEIKNNSVENGFSSYPYDNALFSAPPLSSLFALHQGNNFADFNYDRLWSNSGSMLNYCNSIKNRKMDPAAVDKAFNLHLNNNNNTIHNNNEHHTIGTNGRSDGVTNTGSHKKSMDDVVKRLTSKMNDSSIKEERRSRSPLNKKK